MSRPDDARLVALIDQGATASDLMVRLGVSAEEAQALHKRGLALTKQRRLMAELRFIDESLRSWGWGPHEWHQLQARREKVLEQLKEIEE